MTAKQLAGRVGGASPFRQRSSGERTPQAGSLACPWRRGAVLKVAGLALLRSVQGAVVAVNRRAARAGSEGATPHASADHAAARTGASSVCGMKMQAKSAAIPYLDAPPALDGSMAGDVGFDPLWVSSALPDAGWIKYLREVSATVFECVCVCNMMDHVRVFAGCSFSARSLPEAALVRILCVRT